MKHVLLVSMMVLGAAAPALASGDELDPVPVMPLMSRPYVGQGEPALIRFINVRPEPVRVHWIDLSGSPRPYRVLGPGEEYVQPTYVTHRWMAAGIEGDLPLQAFIATRATVSGGGTAQIALIR